MVEPIIGQPGDGDGGTPPSDVIKDTTTEQFAEDVIEASMTVPVVVDFWAPWCGPCKQLGPILEKTVRNAGGKVKLVKLDIDEHPQIPQQLRIQSIPAVFAFKNGQPVDGFVGAQPESQIRAFVERLAGPMGPSASEQLLEAGAQAFEAGDLARAAQTFGRVLQEEPGEPAALGGLAKCYIANGDLERAKQTLALVPPNAKNHPDVAGAEAALALQEETADVGDVADLRAKVEANPKDHQARFDLAMAEMNAGRREEAVEALLEIVRRERNWNDEAARKQLVKFFEAFGPTDPLTIEARKKLSAILFS